MKTALISIVCALVLIGCSSEQPVIVGDAGEALDSGSGPDAGEVLDAGERPDASEVLDAGEAQDAGEELDAGTSPDAGEADAGEEPDAGSAPDAGHVPDVGCEELNPMFSTYQERLAEVMKTCDVYPWIEVLKLGPVPNGQAAGYTLPAASWKKPYSMLIREFALVAYKCDIIDLRSLLVDFAYELKLQQQSSIRALSGAMLGDALNGWHGFREGLYLPKDEAISFNITTRDENGANGGMVYLVARGYRLYPKGTISPVQLSRDEHAAAGMRLVPFTYATQIVLSDPAETYSAEVQFDDDFLIDGVRTSASGHGADTLLDLAASNRYAAIVDVKLDSDRTIMPVAANRFVVAGPSRNNEWLFDLPITVGSGTRFNVEANVAQDDLGINLAAQVTAANPIRLEVVFHGHKLVRVQ